MWFYVEFHIGLMWMKKTGEKQKMGGNLKTE